MTDPTPPLVAIAPGSGLLVRRPAALLFVPDATGPTAARLAERFAAAGSDHEAIGAVTDTVIDDDFATAPFSVVHWGRGLSVLVMGALELRTDHPALPMISGAGSTSWVERTLSPQSSTDEHGEVPMVEVSVGESALDGTDLGSGRVLAGGFRARLPVTRPSAPAHEPAPSPSPPAPSPPAPSPTVAAPAMAPPADDARERGLDALRRATGGDWMEDSLGLRAVPQLRPEPRPEPGEQPDGPAADRWTPTPSGLDDEVTLAPDDLGHPDAAHTSEPADGVAIVRARRCPVGHPNAPESARCSMCETPLDPAAAPESVAQPVLGHLRLPDGRTIPIDRSILLGRRPSVEVARVNEAHVDVQLDHDAGISRTHLVVRAEGWTITATDCASRSGTAVIPAEGDDPFTLEPWVPHQVDVGARIHLGGPFAVTVLPARPTGSFDGS